jgi:hypothetical protein
MSARHIGKKKKHNQHETLQSSITVPPEYMSMSPNTASKTTHAAYNIPQPIDKYNYHIKIKLTHK